VTEERIYPVEMVTIHCYPKLISIYFALR